MPMAHFTTVANFSGFPTINVTLAVISSHSETNEKDVLRNFTRCSEDGAETIGNDRKGGEKDPNDKPLEEIGVSGDVNMEASITPHDVIQAGGFGVKDDISSFLPNASDSTYIEASICDAQDYEEEPHSEVTRSLGLG